MIKKLIKSEKRISSKYQQLLPHITGNVAIICCKADTASIRSKILSNVVPAPAKQGVIAPIDVTIKPGATGMDPSQTSFFQAMGISTKIVKAQIEIQSEVLIIKKGEKVSASAATLLKKLNIKPFTYGFQPQLVYDNGETYSSDVLDMDKDYLLTKIGESLNYVAALGLATGIPNAASVQHSIKNALKYIASICLETNTECKFLHSMQSNSPNQSQAQPTNIDTTKHVEEKQEEPESDEDIGFSLFD